MYELRPYQRAASDAVFREWQTVNKTLITLPTGTGKTVVFADITKKMVSQGKKVLILAHREELLQQAREKLMAATEIPTELEKAEFHASNTASCVVASVQSLCRPDRLQSFSPDHFDVIIVDEAHHIAADSYQTIVNYFNNSKLLGVTATAKRADRRALSECFESIAYNYDIKDAMNDGWISPIMVQTVPVEIDLSDVHIQMGDFVAGELGRTIEPYFEEIASKLETLIRGRKTLIFLPLVEMSQEFVQVLARHNIFSKEVNCNTPNRKEIIDGFRNNDYHVLVNSMLLTEGTDIPDVNCIINLRPTKSEVLYRQIAGRGLRLFPGKENLLILDFLWQSKMKGYDILTPIDIFSNEEHDSFMEASLREGGMLTDIINRAREARERALYEALKRHNIVFHGFNISQIDSPDVHYNIYTEAGWDYCELVSVKVDSALLDFYGVGEFTPLANWEVADMTPNQAQFLINAGCTPEDVKKITYKGFASKIINLVQERRNQGLSSYKQYKMLTRYKFKNVENWTTEECSEIMDKIAKNNWRVPYGMQTANYYPERLRPKQTFTGTPVKARIPQNPTPITQPTSVPFKSPYSKPVPPTFPAPQSGVVVMPKAQPVTEQDKEVMSNFNTVMEEDFSL